MQKKDLHNGKSFYFPFDSLRRTTISSYVSAPFWSYPVRQKQQEMKTNEVKTQTIVRQDKKVARNDPCPCGSGKKYKDCCGR